MPYIPSGMDPYDAIKQDLKKDLEREFKAEMRAELRAESEVIPGAVAKVNELLRDNMLGQKESYEALADVEGSNPHWKAIMEVLASAAVCEMNSVSVEEDRDFRCGTLNGLILAAQLLEATRARVRTGSRN